MKTFALLLVLLMASPALSQTVNTSSLDPGSSIDFQRSYGTEGEGDGTTRALQRQLRDALIDVGLRGIYCKIHRLGSGVARFLGIADDPETIAKRSDRRVTCLLQTDPLDLTVGVDLIHRRGVTTNVEVDLDDRRIAVGFEGRHRINYGLAYEEETDTLQALVTLPF